ncbi:NIPSNAP family protein [Arenibacter sp. M-2]|uniref:NIPSNAP family protein n=1 Tax=Arenibacter sp. M-2 TaxID=3053612 RepID=UPI002570DF79|nr:NIPSNAP family protein [Arenibacter sp. M-2]MDL5513800.1 NIPSNAP family protein [Arenibacter sp. M-2]|tara:strand:- start:16402 stop:17178 length:777 start_codon:yes stop_codon:yes gene_type:complete
MYKTAYISVLLLLFTINTYSQANQREYYQLKTYLLDTEEQEKSTDDYLSKALLPALKKLNIKNVGVFKPRTIDSLHPRSIKVLIPMKAIDDMETMGTKLQKDKVYMATAKDFLDAPYNNPPYSRVESVILKAFVEMPKMKPSPLGGPRKDRIYELRSYESATEAKYINKVAMFNKGGEVSLFDSLGFNAVFYGEVLSGATMPNLMYMTTFENQASRDAHWKSFSDSPVWNKLKSDPNYQNNVSKNVTRFFYPTEYSDY